MKVIHLTSAHPRYDTRIFFKMCSSLAQHGFNVSLIVADGKGNECKNGVNIHDVGAKTGGRISRMTNTVTKVFEKAKALDAELYHLHDPELMPIGLKLKKLGKKVIFDAHEDLPKQLLSKPYLNKYVAIFISKLVSEYEEYACKRLDSVVAATPYIRDKFVKLNIKSIDINNFPILEELSMLDTSNFYNRKNCCYIGGITKVRGIVEIVDSLNMVNDQIKLNLAGRFSEHSLEKIVKKNSGWNQVVEHGWKNRDGIKSILQDSFAGLVTLYPIINYQDSLPVKMFEYMAAGIPVIYSDIPYWRGIIDKEHCGISVDPYSPDEISTAIEFLSNNLTEAKLMGENGRKAILERYNWTIEEKKLVELYEGLLN